MNINAYKPKGSVKGGNLISLTSLSQNDIFEYLYATRDFKQKARVGEKTPFLTGKYVALISKSAYFRSRIAFQIAIDSLGGKPLTVSLDGVDIENALKDADVIRNLRDYGVSAFIIDTSYAHDAELLEHYSGSPVINANAKTGPCHALSALFTAWEKFGRLSGLRMTFVGDLSKNDNSILTGAAKCGINLNVLAPENVKPSLKVTDYCRQFCNVEFYTDKEDAVRASDVIYVCENAFGPDYTIDELDLMRAHRNAILLHSFPLIRGKDVTDDAADSPQSLIFRQSENLIPVLKAVLFYNSNQ